jgi:hypothetical protein
MSHRLARGRSCQLSTHCGHLGVAVPLPKMKDAHPLGLLVSEGAVRLTNAAIGCLADLDKALQEYPADEAGVRIHGNARLKRLLDRELPIGSIAASSLGERSRPVRAILFNKTPKANWSLGWHQDRTIAVHQQRDVPGFGPWTVKAGMNHVEPPFELLARMVTLRVHLDDVDAQNAPLLVAPGSHRIGRVREADIDQVVRRCGTVACLAAAGDVWLYSTTILHASEAARAPKARRVLQVDYAAEDLLEGLEWLGI